MTKALDRGSYSEEEITRGLSAAAYFNGNTRRAADALKEQGLKIPRSTLRDWLNTRQDRYEQVRTELTPKIHAYAAEQHMDLAQAQIELSREFMERMRADKDKIPARDLSTFQRNLDTGAGIHTDKALALRGAIPEGQSTPTRTLNEILAAMKAKGMHLTLEVGPNETPRTVEGMAIEVEGPEGDPEGD
jgi:hypothetical protein